MAIDSYMICKSIYIMIHNYLKHPPIQCHGFTERYNSSTWAKHSRESAKMLVQRTIQPTTLSQLNLKNYKLLVHYYDYPITMTTIGMFLLFPQPFTAPSGSASTSPDTLWQVTATLASPPETGRKNVGCVDWSAGET